MCDNCTHCMVIGGPCRTPGCIDVVGHPGPCPRGFPPLTPGDLGLKTLEEALKSKKKNKKRR